MFNMTQIGRTIACLRREHDMTQVNLADQMGVSCQAVSLWETGKSMPDIAKLPELAAIFGVTIDDLLGGNVPVITHALDGDLPDRTADGTVTVQDLTDAAPILPPSQINEAVRHLADHANITSLLPFLDTETVDEMMAVQAQKGQNIAMYLPFASEDAIVQVALHRLQHKQPIDAMFPFLPDDFLKKLALAAVKQ